MSIITIMTDFGLKDGFVGVMRGVIWSIAPEVRIADISHQIAAQDVYEGALVLARSAPYFPDGTIHIAVVDPGVGTTRRPIAAMIGKHFFVGPDNGLFTPLYTEAERNGWPVEVVHLDRPRFWRKEISYVFHGRDIFSPVAAHLANGVPLNEMGTPIQDPIRLEISQPERSDQGWRSSIVHIDNFGNLATSLLQEHLEGMDVKTVRLCGREIQGMVHTFGDRPVGELVALIGSTGNLVVCVVNGNAARELGAKKGDMVEVLAN